MQKFHWHCVRGVWDHEFPICGPDIGGDSLCVLSIGFIALWLKGIKSILLPGLGLILATPLIILILLVVAVVTGILAWLAKSEKQTRVGVHEAVA